MIFFLEFFVNDGVCLVYEGNHNPGHLSKNSVLDREFKQLDVRHKSVCTGEILLVSRKQDLTHKEKRSLRCLMEHDRMLLNSSDRQHFSLCGDQIDEFKLFECRFVRMDIEKDPNGSLMIGGLRSLCMNARYYVDHVDRVGRVLHSFDGMFEFEIEKEFFYLECSICSLRTSNRQIVLFKECRIVRLIASMHRLLDKFGRVNCLPRSSMRVDEDVWYMRGENGCVDDSKCGSIFHTRIPSAL